MKKAPINNPVQGFAPSSIVSVTSLNTEGVLAIRVGAAATYQINAVGVSADMAAGSVTVIADNVSTIDFAVATVVEVMKG